MARKILITSGKGGVGKTTICAYLGWALADFGLRVCLVDLDMGLNNLDIVTGIEDRITYDVVDAVLNKCRVKQSLIKTENENLYVIACNHSFEKCTVNPQSLKLLLETLSPSFDVFLVDCPAGIDKGFHRAAAVCEEALVVTTTSLASVRDADKVISILKGYGMESVEILVNKVRGDLVVENKVLSPLEIEGLLKVKLRGVIPDLDEIALSYGQLPKGGKGYKSFKILAENLSQGKSKIYDYQSKYCGLFGSIKRRIRKSV